MHRPRREAAIPTATAVAMTEQKCDYDDVDSDTKSVDNPLYPFDAPTPTPAPAPVPQKLAPSSTRRRPAVPRRTELSLPSKMYDLDGDGVLDPVEQVMRERDGSGRGFLKNHEIYAIVKEELSAEKRAGRMKRLVIGLMCFVALLATSNLATSWASASLAKDLKADDGLSGEDDGTAEDPPPPPAMRITSTGKIASAQTVADVYDAVEMTDGQLEHRRRLVLSEIEEDPHSHAHRRNLLACRACRARDCRCDTGAQTITFDSRVVPQEEFDVIEKDCARQKNVYVRRRWGEGGRRNSRNEAICSGRTSVTVKMKKIKKKKKKEEKEAEAKDEENKKEGKEGDKTKKITGRGDWRLKWKRNRDREVIIERDDGRTLHADCIDGLCYCGGTILQGTQGDDCRIGADECQKGYVCQPENKKLRNVARYGTCARASVDMTDVVFPRNALAGAYCNYAEGLDACVDGYHCRVNEDDDSHRYNDGPLGNFGLQIIDNRSGRRGGGGRNNYGDCTDDRDSCASGYGCIRSRGSDSGYGEDDRWSCMFGATDDMELRSSPSSSGGIVGTCFANVGFGQTCRSDYECGRDGYCAAGIVMTRDRDGASHGTCAHR